MNKRKVSSDEEAQCDETFPLASNDRALTDRDLCEMCGRTFNTRRKIDWLPGYYALRRMWKAGQVQILP